MTVIHCDSPAHQQMALWVNSASFDARVSTLMRDFHVPGLSVAILHGDTVYSRSYGHATIESSTPVDTDTIFDAASCSKALTAVAMAILIETHPKLNVLGWKTLVADLLGEDFMMHRDEDAKVITVEDLLSHTTGFSGHDMSVLGVNAARPDNVRSVARNLRNLPSNAIPGEKYQYCNIMYSIVTHIIEVLSGETFSVFLRTKILEPLGMTTTFLQPSEVHAARLDAHFATPYFYDAGKHNQSVHQETPELQGAGSIQSTPSDYLKFLAAMLKHNLPPITESIFNGVASPRVMKDSKKSLADFGPESRSVAYALGWDVKYRSGQQIIAHDGIITGYGSSMFFLPGLSFAAVFMGNCGSAFGVSQLLQQEMIDDFLNVPTSDRFDHAQGRLKKQAAQDVRKQKKMKRNHERRLRARNIFTVPATNYCGNYYNAGYRSVAIEVHDGDLFINASDRSEPFTMVLEHLEDNRKFRGYINVDDGAGEDEMLVEFRLNLEDNVSAVGFNWEPLLGEEHFFWHDRTH